MCSSLVTRQLKNSIANLRISHAPPHLDINSVHKSIEFTAIATIYKS